MMKMQRRSTNSSNKQDRRRGRPAGKNRTPLSLEERRARNAQYERERRNETADAMVQLAEAACCDPRISNAELLATVISSLQRRAKRKLPKDIEDLKRTNENLESQIALLQSRLGHDVDDDDCDDNISEDLNDFNPDQYSDACDSNNLTEETLQRESNAHGSETKIKCRSNLPDSNVRSSKIRKTSKSSSVHETIQSESDQSDTDSDTECSESVSVHYQLRNRTPKLSEQSERTTSTYLHGTESESTMPNELDSDESNQSDGLDPMNERNPSAMPDQSEGVLYDEQTENALLDTLLTDGEKNIINEWLDCSETLNATTDHVDNQVRKFLEFDNFLLDINA